MSLQNVQAEIADTIQSPDHPTDLVTPNTHIAIHHHHFITALTDTLKSVYPMIVKLVGDDFFAIAAQDYIKQYPSRSGNLHDYGEYFSDFLAHYPPVRDLAYLPEVAQFEWTSHTVFFAADHPGLDTTQFNNIPRAQFPLLHFSLHPAIKLMKCHFPMLRIIELCKGEVDDTLDVSQSGVNLLIGRREHNVTLISLTDAEFTFLSALHDNLPLADALELAVNVDADFNLEDKLSVWALNKIIVDVIS